MADICDACAFEDACPSAHFNKIDIETGGRWSGIPFAVGAENGASFCYNIKARNLHCYRCMPLPEPPEVSE